MEPISPILSFNSTLDEELSLFTESTAISDSWNWVLGIAFLVAAFVSGGLCVGIRALLRRHSAVVHAKKQAARAARRNNPVQSWEQSIYNKTMRRFSVVIAVPSPLALNQLA
ncbi:unnamed protein product [Heligmosomoides polygyrus]|uniref:Transmembrane protein n=1 Tax=Heligmosomoides polygyrus TaxID=6339 RepID=A0A183G3K1_HELPZ|nr:unnamed protein product [Heligmosomoides polygyrus]